MKKFYSWSTTKKGSFYIWAVTENTPLDAPNGKNQYVDAKIIKTGAKDTRAQAKGLAKKWARMFKAQDKFVNNVSEVVVYA